MPTGPVLAIAVAAALLIYGVDESVKGIKKLGHKIEKVFHKKSHTTQITKQP